MEGEDGGDLVSESEHPGHYGGVGEAGWEQGEQVKVREEEQGSHICLPHQVLRCIG